MDKIGYIFNSTTGDACNWMNNYGCSRIMIDSAANETTRPQRRITIRKIKRGDELVVERISKTVRDCREFSVLLELCNLRNIRLISIEDRIDTAGKLFACSPAEGIIRVMAQLPFEVHRLKQEIGQQPLHDKGLPASPRQEKRMQRDEKVINMYLAGYSVTDIMEHTGVSQTSLFRILRHNNIPRDRHVKLPSTGE